MLIRSVLAAAFAAALAGCTSAPAETAAAEAKPDPRQGEEVRQVCFTQTIRNWRELDRESILIERGVREVYKLDLIGTCEPDDAFLNIGLVQRGGGSCLSKGDRVVTDSRFDGVCHIRGIYRWNEDAAKDAPEGAAPASTD